MERLIKPFDAAGIGHINSLCQVKTHANTGDDKFRWLFSVRRGLQAFQRLDGLIHVDLVLGEGGGWCLWKVVMVSMRSVCMACAWSSDCGRMRFISRPTDSTVVFFIHVGFDRHFAKVLKD